MSEHLLNIAEICPVSENLGPGKRFVLWVQGCPFSCPGCVSPNWIPFQSAQLFTIEQMAQQILSTKDIQGITISGGEPFMQAARLAKLIQVVKTVNPSLTVIVFTGFEQNQLVWKDAKAFLDQIDVIITGLYVQKHNDGKGLRGSSNQKIIFLTEALKPYEEEFYQSRKNLEFHVQKDGVLMVGIPQKDFKW